MKHSTFPLALGALLVLSLGSAQAQRAARDDASSPLRAPTAAEVKAMEATKASRPVGLVSGRVNPQPVTHADGTVQYELDTSTVMYSVARRNADGSVSQYCVSGPEAAEKLVKGKVGTPVAAKATKEHEHAVK